MTQDEEAKEANGVDKKNDEEESWWKRPPVVFA
jgi:hypothetical protein